MKIAQDTALRIKQMPRQQRALKRIEAILAAAAELIAEQGYENLSMVGIAARAGITHTSIYRYFASMEDLLAALLGEFLSDFDRHISERVKAAGNPGAFVEAVLNSIAYGFDRYRQTPAARGLWTTTRYLPRLRQIEQEDSERVALLLTEHLLHLRPGLVRENIRLALGMLANLTVPAYEFALMQAPERQEFAAQEFFALVRLHLQFLVEGDTERPRPAMQIKRAGHRNDQP